MKYHELNTSRQQKSKRSGRGISAGRGKTAGRGTKGQGSRKSPVKVGFEGGQTPLHMRLPKLRGFKSRRPATEVVYTNQLNAVKPVIVDNTALAEAKLISSAHTRVKLIASGELKVKKTVKLQSASASAIELVKKAGGTFEANAQIPRPSKKDKTEA